tara:strand:+ start:278 stop:2815 length:2538 start_codon:yes stop_codon:yes gene_type:complete
MSLIKGNHAGLGGSGAPGGALGSFYSHTIGQSIRVERGDTGRLDISFSGDGDSQALGTFSWWMKRTELGRSQSNVWFEQSGYGGIQFRSDKLAVNSFDSSNTQVIVETDAVFRDPSSWYHFMVRVNGTAGTIQFYVNGVEQAQTVTNGSLASSRSWDFLNHDSRRDFYLFSNSNGGNGTSALFAEFHFLDGLSYDPSYFGETKDGVWVPKAYSGSHGTNGFYLPFDDSSAIGDDESANTNDFSANNLVASDVVPDSPTNNFCTMNPLAYTNGITLSEGNLTMATTTNNRAVHGTIALPSSGKWYVELHVDSYASGGGIYAGFGSNASLGYDEVAQPKGVFMSTYNQAVTIDNSAGGGNYNTQGNNSSSNGDIYQLLLDVDNKVFYIGKNGTYRNSADPANGTGGLDVTSMFTNAVTDLTVCLTRGGSYNETYSVNFGQDSKDVASANADGNGIGTFEYAPPSGFLALCTSNLPDITIGPGQSSQADDHFNTVLYTGDGSTQSVTGVGFSPDWVWLKGRSRVTVHSLHDVLRGTQLLQSNASDGQQDNSNYLTAYGADGFTVGDNSNVNHSSATYVSWNWKAGGTPSGDNSAANNAEPTAGSAKIDGSNQSGAFSGSPSIAIKRLSASTAAGISIVRWTGTGSAGTIPHGLGAAPDFYVVKNITDDGTSWQAYHVGIASDAETDYIYLNGTAAADDSDDWNDTAPTANVFSVNSHNQVNASGDEYLAYLFTSIESYSKHASFVGNGNADGTFVYTGFRPAWVMIRRSSGSGGWHMFDNKRAFAGNEIDVRIEAQETEAENTSGPPHMDLVSNGFKLRTTFDNMNASGSTYIYLAFAEAPFKFANAR